MYFLNETQEDKDKNITFIGANDETGFLHLYLYKYSLVHTSVYSEGILKGSQILKQPLTQGDWCVEHNDNVSVDQENHLVYFTAYKDPIESHLYVFFYKNPTYLDI